MAAELYRLHVARKRGGASWGDVQFYEGRDALEAELTTALLDIAAEKERGFKLQVLRAWQRWRGKPADGPDATRIVKFQELVDGEWVDRTATLIAPRVEIH